ncbi:MAG: glycosyltransferase family 39 protein, partial [Anaerolineales bacterium]|nr:glycosyltransferase family 39 protein [Anaerolineales bacterium]
APFGLIASRTFQPDPMMTAMIVTAWMAFYHWYKSSSWKWTILAGITAGAAMYIKSTSVFFLLFGMGIVVLSRKKILETLKDIQVWVIILLSGLPVLAYHIHGIFITGELESTLEGRFFPQLWNDLSFYLQWNNALSKVTGHYLILIIGLVGLFLVKKRRDQMLLGGIWLGYLLYGFGFSYHIITHYYYTLPVIPLLAVTLGAVSDRIIIWLRRYRLEPIILAGSAALVIIGVSGGYYIFATEDYRNEPAYYQKVANFVDPEDKIVALSQDYGDRLSYYGWRVVHPWKGTEDLLYMDLRDSEEDLFSVRFSKYSDNYDYFIITRMEEFRKQKELFNELNNHYPILVEGGGYIIFNLNERFE